MPLDPDTAAFLKGLAARGVPGPADSSVAQARAVLRGIAGVDRRDPADLPPVAAVEEATVGGVPARVYRPETLPAPTVVYLHGGGFVIGDLDTHEGTVRTLARDTGAVVVSVDYALAPEHPFPAGLEDAWRALADVAARIDDFGGDAGRLAIGGDSAGANLAAVTAVRARDEGLTLAAQLLVYPATDPGGDHPSRHENAEGYFLTARDMDWFFAQYVGDGDPAALVDDPRIAPLRTPDLSGVAPAVVATGQYDPLRDEGDAYADALLSAGVPVLHLRFPGLIHGFYGTPLPAAAAATAEIDRALAGLLA